MSLEDQHTDRKSLRTITGKSADWDALAELTSVATAIRAQEQNQAHYRLAAQE